MKNLIFFFICVMHTNIGYAQKIFAQEVFGEVYFRAPFETNWSKLKINDQIPENSMIKVRDQSSIRVVYQSKEENYEIRLNTPMVLRINKFLLREVKKDIISKQSPRKNEHIVTSFINDVLNSYREDIQLLDEPEEKTHSSEIKKYTEAVQRSVPIELVVPQDLEKVYVNQYPYIFHSLWYQNSNIRSYNIYFWESDKARGSAIQVVKDNHSEIQVIKNGIYYFQVTSDDMKYQSQIMRLEFTTDLVKQSGKELPTISKNVEDSRAEINLEYPVDKFFLIKKNLSETEFVWNDNLPYLTNVQYILTIEDTKTKKKMTAITSKKSYKFKLLPGDYKWFVIANTTEYNRSKTIFSEYNTLSISEIKDINQLNRYLDTIHLKIAKENSQIFIEGI